MSNQSRKISRTGRPLCRITAILLALCLTWQTGAKNKTLAAEEPYTYTVTLYAGNQGSFTGTEQVRVDNSKTGSSYTITGTEDRITVEGLENGDIVAFDAAAPGAVALANDSKYYVKGVRLSGRDNNTVASPAFTVQGDADYVVAYGIQGDMTSYTVNFRDSAGQELAPSRTYYGNVGDKPVVAFLYINDYEPQAYNLTKTLSANAAENVFTFLYTRIVIPSAPTPGGDTGSGSGTGEEPENPGQGGQGGAVQAPGGNTGTGTTPGGATAPGTGGETEDESQTPETEESTAPEETEEVDENPIPQGPGEIEDLDDPDVPKGGMTVSDEPKDQKDMIPYVAAAIAVIALAALILLFLWLKKSKKKEAEEKAAPSETPEKEEKQ